MSNKKTGKNFITRRSFLKSGMILTVGLPTLRSYALFGNAATVDASDPLFTAFQNPPVTARPFVRWWWNGDKVTAKEILRELDVMRDAGIGGVEINPIAFPGGADLGLPSLKWLSPEWIEMVKVALKGAEERGMVCDIIVGSGWPFG
ncbi:MAG: glycoside hydrolase family 2, partial [Tannerella sp.]|nr:glycoside hydrolase family 2 [Tannerella sp.]